MEHTKHQDKSWNQKQVKLKMKEDRKNAVKSNLNPEPKSPVKYIKPQLSFKQLSEMGVVRAKLTKNLIKYNEVPQWMKDVWSAESTNESPIANEPMAHEHDENCNHE